MIRPGAAPADAVVMRALLQVLSPADAATAVANAARALRPGGSFVLAGAVL
ncbi:MAG: methyltransferase domain-containing protein, partial [Tagaea sp.]